MRGFSISGRKKTRPPTYRSSTYERALRSFFILPYNLPDNSGNRFDISSLFIHLLEFPATCHLLVNQTAGKRVSLRLLFARHKSETRVCTRGVIDTSPIRISRRLLKSRVTQLRQSDPSGTVDSTRRVRTQPTRPEIHKLPRVAFLITSPDESHSSRDAEVSPAINR